MTFVNLSLLAGTALVALPIVLHLIMRQRPKRLEFPALRFLQKQHDTNRRRLRLRHLLLLLLRAAAIALLACGLARPSVNFSGSLGSQEAPVAAVMVFDAAPRMEYRHGNQSRLEAAGELGLWLLSQLPSQSEIAVLDTRPGPATFQVDAAAARQRIERLESVANSQPLWEAVEEALRLLGESSLARKELYVFGDLSRAAWPADSAAKLQRRIAEVPDVGIYLIDVGIQEPNNYALGGLRLSGQVLSNRSPLRIETELSRAGPPGTRTVELHLVDDRQREQKRGQQSYDLESDRPQRVEFRIESLEVGTHQGVVRIVGQDGLACDDARYFTVEVKPAWRVLLVAPEPTDQYDVFLAQALAPTESRKRGDAQFECRTIAQNELLEHGLASYAAVCLLDPKPMAPAAWKKLADFAADGHGVAVFLGRNAWPVDSFNAPLAQEVLPGKLLRQARAPDGVFPAPRDYQHPVLAEFRAMAGAIPWNSSPVFRYWELDELHSGVGVVLPLTDGRPVLLERPLGDGRAMTMTTPVSDVPNDEAWNLLPVGLEAGQGWPFVILSHQMLSYLVGSTDQRLDYFAGQTVVLKLDTDQPRRTYLLRAPGDLTFPLSADLKRRLLLITATDRVGNYRVQAGRGVDRGFSVNLTAEQTQLERIDEDELSEVFGTSGYRVARTRKEIERDVNRGRVGRELFPALILLVALALGLEHVLANRFYRE